MALATATSDVSYIIKFTSLTPCVHSLACLHYAYAQTNASVLVMRQHLIPMYEKKAANDKKKQKKQEKIFEKKTYKKYGFGKRSSKKTTQSFERR